MHFRTSDGKEVDFTLERPDDSVFAIEIKRAESVSIQDFKGIQLLAGLTGKDFAGGVVLYGGKDTVPFSKNLWMYCFIFYVIKKRVKVQEYCLFKNNHKYH